MKKFISCFLFCIFSLISCNSSHNLDKTTRLKIGVTSIPHGEILDNIKKVYGLDFEIINYKDYSKLNEDLINNKIDANFYQTKEYMDNFNKNNGNRLVDLAHVHVEPMIIYSNKYKSVDNVEDGDILYIPNDEINRNRALKLLENANLITLSKDVIDGKYLIAINPKNLIINEVQPSDIPQYFSQADLVVMNTNIALENNIDPRKDGIFYENSFKDKSKFNVFVTRDDMINSVKLKEIVNYLNSDVTFNFIMDKYNGFVKPVF